ncbi:MAG: phosphoribosyl-AMP cyclohydrolase [Proteobacteria bacterium]|nr:MAG: phosphoribosyl-AMP cyclohydrolase [Pseudomonadota bacterium]
MTTNNADPAPHDPPSEAFIAHFIGQLTFNNDGLIPAIAQQYDTGEVLMMAWMNSESIRETLRNNRVCYWSRSRGKLWRKGESSGQVQMLKGFRIDCDADTLLLAVDQTGPACHTGRRSCFYQVIDGDSLITDSEPLIDPKALYGQ